MYLQDVAVVNAVRTKVNAEEKALGVKPYRDFVKDDQEWLTALEAWQAALYKINWPASVQSQATALVAANQAEILAFQSFVASPNQATSNGENAPGQASSAAAAALRLALHLPPIVQP
jgi:hypothetical protein